MPRSLASLLLASLLLAATACERAADRPDDGHAAGTASGSDSVAAAAGAEEGEHGGEAHATDEHATDEHATAGHAAAGAEGQALLPIMQRLGSEMTTLTYALMTDDHATVTRSAAAIAEHAPISAEELERIRAELGPEMAAFEAVDESVHVASVRLRDAARARQPALVVQRLGEVQSGCVSCHAQFRERLRTGGGAR